MTREQLEMARGILVDAFEKLGTIIDVATLAYKDTIDNKDPVESSMKIAGWCTRLSIGYQALQQMVADADGFLAAKDAEN